MKNQLFEKVEYKVEETPSGVWRRFLYPTGGLFEEYVSNSQMMGLPFLHYTSGICPETGRRIIARGFIAIGRRAVGVVAIGQASAGVFALGQASFGLILGIGQATAGLFAIGQLAVGLAFGLGQFATGVVAIGQFALGVYVLANFGLGLFVWDGSGRAPALPVFLRWLVPGARG